MPQDHAEAVKLFEKGAEKGHAMSLNNLGDCYETGKGLPQDFAKAVHYYRLAAEKGVTLSMMSLGNLLQEGKGVSQNKAEAYQWFQKAADKGDEKAKAKLVEWSEVIQAPDKI